MIVAFRGQVLEPSFVQALKFAFFMRQLFCLYPMIDLAVSQHYFLAPPITTIFPAKVFLGLEGHLYS